MSFEPLIIINRADLEAVIDTLTPEETYLLTKLDTPDLSEEDRAKKYLWTVIGETRSLEMKGDRKPLIVGGCRLIVANPEYSSLNRAVREWLEDREIEYGIDY